MLLQFVTVAAAAAFFSVIGVAMSLKVLLLKLNGMLNLQSMRKNIKRMQQS